MRYLPSIIDKHILNADFDHDVNVNQDATYEEGASTEIPYTVDKINTCTISKHGG